MSKSFIVIFLLFYESNALAQSRPGDFVKLIDLDTTFSYDMRYATDNNFLKRVLYECDQCVLRREVAEALIRANDYFKSEGFQILLFDCYRPLDIQSEMWQAYPNPNYVADPRKGSVHNRGGAVDLSLIDLTTGEALDMGTDHDFLGQDAHHDFKGLTDHVRFNRTFLKNGLERYGFLSIRTEWWHYSFGESLKYKVSNFKVSCGD